MGAKVERIGEQIGKNIEWWVKTFLGETGLTLNRVSPGLSEKLYNILPLLVEPIGSVKNLKFAIRTILEAKGEVVTEDKIRGLTQETTRNFIVSVVEFLSVLREQADWPKFIEPEISDEVKDFFSHKGIIASFHSGNPLAAANFLNKLLSQGSDVPRKRMAAFLERQPAILQKPLISFANSFGFVPIFVEEINEKPLEMIRKIQEIPFLVTLFDRPPKEKNSAVEVKFFGKPALFLGEPARLSLSLGRPILPAAVVKVCEGCYTAEIGKIIFPEEYRKTGDKKETVKAITQAVVLELEPIIARHPTSFYSFFERFWVEQG